MQYPIYVIFIALGFFLTPLVFTSSANAEEWNSKDLSKHSGVWIPENEFTAFFDASGQYTVVGAIKNSEDFPVIPTITINIEDGKKMISESFEHVPILPSKEMPFKIKFPEITSKSPILLEPEISYVRTEKTPLEVEVIYDETLVTHEDGHLTGRIINKGNSTVYNIKVFAVIHGFDKVLDVGQNIEMIEKMEPGEIQNFSMYPDPSITDEVYYYSCFAIGDPVVLLNTKRNGEQYIIRILSLHTISNPEFDDEGRNLSLSVLGSWPAASYANFELPLSSEKERFKVFLDDEPIEFIQSMGELKNWHVAFNLPPNTQGELLITGFEEKAIGLNSQKDIEVPSDIEITVFNSPLKQLQIGIDPEDVVCKGDLHLIQSIHGKPACVENNSVKKLVERGWAKSDIK